MDSSRLGVAPNAVRRQRWQRSRVSNGSDSVAAKAENVHRRLNVQASRLADILCHREQRHVGQQLTLAYDRKQIILERSEVSEKLAIQYVEIFDFSDRLLEVRWKGDSLPYRVFSNDQR